MHIYWSHTMKVLGSYVTFVSISLLHVLNWRNIHFVLMKMWSRMFAVNVQSVSVVQLNWDVIVWFTNISDSFFVVTMSNISNVNTMLYVTLYNVLGTQNLITTCLFCELYYSIQNWWLYTCSSVKHYLLLLLLSVHLYSALSLQIPNALHALCQYLANRKHLSDRLK